MLKDLSIGISAKMSFRPGKDLSGISAKMSFRPGKKPNAKDAIKPPKLKTQTLSFHPKIENDALPVSVSECNRIIAVNKFDLAAGLEVGDRIVAVDGVELVGPRIRFRRTTGLAGKCQRPMFLATQHRCFDGSSDVRGNAREGQAAPSWPGGPAYGGPQQVPLSTQAARILAALQRQAWL